MVEGGASAIPGCDAASQDSLHPSILESMLSLRSLRSRKKSCCLAVFMMVLVWWVQVRSTSCSPQLAPLFCWCWDVGCCPGTKMSGLWPPLRTLSHRCQWSGRWPSCHQQIWWRCWSCGWPRSHMWTGSTGVGWAPRGAGVESQGGVCGAAYPYSLGSGRQEVQDSITEGGVELWARWLAWYWMLSCSQWTAFSRVCSSGPGGRGQRGELGWWQLGKWFGRVIFFFFFLKPWQEGKLSIQSWTDTLKERVPGVHELFCLSFCSQTVIVRRRQRADKTLLLCSFDRKWMNETWEGRTKHKHEEEDIMQKWHNAEMCGQEGEGENWSGDWK